ncbi:membrane protein insertion efficiency factor YidD [Patescibacteria group bacterium]|nr:membrane protein insertion efficiency factor YidD [Patescibacteria group bacterium]
MYKIYKRFISPTLHTITTSLFGPGQGCRFSPTCSQYSKESIKKYGIIHGAWLSFLRLLRCHPLSKICLI